MKAGLTIEELATEVMRQKDAKADYIVNTSMLAMEHCGTELVLRVLDDSHICTFSIPCKATCSQKILQIRSAASSCVWHLTN